MPSSDKIDAVPIEMSKSLVLILYQVYEASERRKKSKLGNFDFRFGKEGKNDPMNRSDNCMAT